MTSLYRLDGENQKLTPVGSTTYGALHLKELADIQECVKARARPYKGINSRKPSQEIAPRQRRGAIRGVVENSPRSPRCRGVTVSGVSDGRRRDRDSGDVHSPAPREILRGGEVRWE